MCSKAKYYNSSPDKNELPEDLGAVKRDEIGIVCAICVKVCLFSFHSCDPHLTSDTKKAHSSAQHKVAFKAIQNRRNVPVVRLLMDMKVRWSSTFIMLTHAESHQEAVVEFVLELGLKENNSEKCCKMTSLALNSEEWTRVHLFCNILQVRTNTYFDCTVLMHSLIQHASDAQQVFSSSSTLTLQNALLALEKMHAAWDKASSKAHYLCFIPALNAGKVKLDQYYQRSTESDANIMAMGKSSFAPVYSADQCTLLCSPEPKEEDGTFCEVLAIRAY